MPVRKVHSQSTTKKVNKRKTHISLKGTFHTLVEKTAVRTVISSSFFLTRTE